MSQFCVRFVTALAIITTMHGIVAAQGSTKKAGPEPESAKSTILLNISVVLATTGPTLAFTATNQTNAEVHIADVAVNDTAILITKPNGELFVYSASASPVPGVPIPVLKPSETKTWKVNISDLLVVTDRFREPGIYRLSWVYGDKQLGGKTVTYKSNEIPFLREKDTPVIDPATGRPVPQPK